MLQIVVSRWGQPLGETHHPAGLVRIGSAADNDLQIEHADVAPHHLEVFLRDGQLYARSPDERPLRVGGKRVTGRARVDEHPIPIGDFTFQAAVVRARTVEERARGKLLARARLEGNALVPLEDLNSDEQLILDARRILLGRNAPTRQLKRLDERGVPLAKEIVEHHAQQGLDGVAGTMRETSERQLAEGLARAEAARPHPERRLAKLAALALLALIVLGLFVWRVVDLVLSFTE